MRSTLVYVKIAETSHIFCSVMQMECLGAKIATLVIVLDDIRSEDLILQKRIETIQKR